MTEHVGEDIFAQDGKGVQVCVEGWVSECGTLFQAPVFLGMYLCVSKALITMWAPAQFTSAQGD